MANFFKPVAKAKISQEPLITYIDKLDHHGVGIARWGNKPLFIAGALPNETVKVKMIEQKNKYARAKLLSVEESNKARVQPYCNHFGLCGGCDLQMLSIEGQLAFKKQKVAELFSRSFSAKNIVQPTLPWFAPIESEPWHYRRKARIGVQFDKQSQATIGFRQKSSNRLAAVKSCPVLAEPINDIFPLLKKLLTQLTVKSAIGHIEVLQADISDKEGLTEQVESDQVVLVIRQLKAMSKADITLWLSYAQQHCWHLIVDDGNKQTPLLDNSQVINTALSYALPNQHKVYFESGDFIQINHAVNIAMIEQALRWLTPHSSDKILDLFCGLGNFSLALAQHVQQVVGVEGVQVMVDKAIHNAQLNEVNNCQFYQADLNSDWLLESWVKQNRYNKVLVDPARAGAEQAVLQIATLKIPSVLYVSCDPATLARDSAVLVSEGYKIEKISIMDMFSQTKHVETMVLFTL